MSKNIFIGLLTLTFFNFNSYAQRKVVRTEYATIICIDSTDLQLFYFNPSYTGYQFIYNIFHLKVLTAAGDSLIVGIVYNINKETDSIARIKKLLLKPYKFTLSEFTPADSDFPLMANCNYDLSIYKPRNNSFLFGKSYKSILRVIEISSIDPELYEEYKKLFPASK